MTDETNRWIASKSETAEFFKVALKTVDDWVRRGCPVRQKGSRGIPFKLFLPDVVDWRLGKSDGSGEKLDLNQETAKLKRVQTEKAELELAALQRDLIPVDEIKSYWADRFVNFQSRLVTAPPRIARGDPKIEVLAKQIIWEALDELSRSGVPPSSPRTRDRAPRRPSAKPKSKRVGRRRKTPVKGGKRGGGKVAPK